MWYYDTDDVDGGDDDDDDGDDDADSEDNYDVEDGDTDGGENRQWEEARLNVIPVEGEILDDIFHWFKF